MRTLSPSRSGKPLTGKYANVLSAGGRLKDCSCSAPLHWSYEDGGNVKACQKGESCVHTVAVLLYGMAKSGWTEADARSFVFDRSCVAFTWVRCMDDPEATFIEYWKGSQEIAYAAPLQQSVLEPYQAPLQQSKKKPVTRFRYVKKMWVELLDFIEANPGLGRNEIVFGMPWREGITHKYLQKAVELGYVSYTVGARRKRSYSLLERPEALSKTTRPVAVSEPGIEASGLEALLTTTGTVYVDTTTGEVIEEPPTSSLRDVLQQSETPEPDDVLDKIVSDIDWSAFV